MMDQVPVKLGPLALLLAVISICVTTLSVLVYTTSRADAALAEKYADTVAVRYALEEEGQRYLLDIAQGTAGFDVQEAAFEKEGMLLHVAVESGPDGPRVISWRFEKEWTEDTDIGTLWDGK